MKFVLSYSCGKDSTLALDEMLMQGHTPVGLLVMINEEFERSWFHGVDPKLLARISDALNIPLIKCPCSGAQYHTAFEDGLRRARDMGAQACVFGDIDIQDNAKWCRERCESTGIEPRFPLWQRKRHEVVDTIITLGYDCIIKCVRNADLPQSLLGTRLDRDALEIMRARGIDICGENGEYHTLVVGGPIFKAPVPYEILETLELGSYSAVNVVLKE